MRLSLNFLFFPLIHLFLLVSGQQNPDPFPEAQAHFDISPELDEESVDEEFNSETNPCLEDDSHDINTKSAKNCLHHVGFVENSDNTFMAPEVTSHLTALSGKYTKRVYPPRPTFTKAFQRYAEPPYGPTLFFCTLFLVLSSWYMQRLLGTALRRTAKKLDLHPEIQEFPRINQYSLQQSKREASLRREARNTWAWMAKKYLLMQNDPKVDVSVFRTTWSDFDLPKDVWGIVRTVLKAGAWIGKATDRLRTSMKDVKGPFSAKDKNKDKLRKSVQILVNGKKSSSGKDDKNKKPPTTPTKPKPTDEHDEHEHGGGLWRSAHKDQKRVSNWMDLLEKRASNPDKLGPDTPLPNATSSKAENQDKKPDAKNDAKK